MLIVELSLEPRGHMLLCQTPASRTLSSVMPAKSGRLLIETNGPIVKIEIDVVVGGYGIPIF